MSLENSQLIIVALSLTATLLSLCGVVYFACRHAAINTVLCLVALILFGWEFQGQFSANQEDDRTAVHSQAKEDRQFSDEEISEVIESERFDIELMDYLMLHPGFHPCHIQACGIA